LRRYITESDSDALQARLLSPEERKVLHDIHLILRLPHSAQELLSSEHTPTTSHAIPVYETLIKSWEALKGSLPHLSGYIDVGIKKVHEYLSLSRMTQIYAFSLGKYCLIILNLLSYKVLNMISTTPGYEATVDSEPLDTRRE
jgi:hypothetical protein